MNNDAAAGLDLATYQMAEMFTRIGKRAVDRAKEQSRRLGVPNVCSINGRLYYELPNGELTLDAPAIFKRSTFVGN